MDTFFFDTIARLRQHEEVILFTQEPIILNEEREYVTSLLKEEYEQEALELPFNPPDFNPEAALWGAEKAYYIAQLLINYKKSITEIQTLLTPFTGELSAGSWLSADLCLRFIPSMLVAAKFNAPQDPLIDQVNSLLKAWHYSGLPHLDMPDALDFSIVKTNQCLLQCYVDRVLKYELKAFAEVEVLTARIKMYT